MATPDRPRRRAARTRTPAGDVEERIIDQRTPRVETLAVPASEAARVVGVSPRHWAGMVARGLAPAGVRLGRRRVWLLDELRAWLAAGAPPRDRWEALRAAREVRA